MDDGLRWLPDTNGTAWDKLGNAIRDGLHVPFGFVISRCTPEEATRAAYEKLKIRERVHFVAVRGESHSVMNVIGPDALIHTIRRFWAETPDAPSLVQRMIHSIYCGKAHRHRDNLRIKVNEGMLILDPDTYLVNSTSGECIQYALEPKQRKMIRHVDGSSRIVEREGARTPMPAALLAKIASLSMSAGCDLAWAIDDLERIWLISVYSTKIDQHDR
jgi:hypothetical protein